MVTPYKTEGVIDYERLVDQFGTQEINDELLMRLQNLTDKELHPWLRRGLFFSHRSLEEVVNCLEKKEKVYLYTGRGPSSESLHLGHLIPFIFTKWLQDTFDLPLVIQITDDEKFFHKDMTLEECHKIALENIKDILSVGFNIEKTFVFVDTKYIGSMYPNICKIQKCVNVNLVQKAFGFTIEDNIGKYSYVPTQITPCFSSSFKEVFGESSNYQCLIPCAIDQDPFFRLARDVAHKLKFKKPAVIHSKFFPALEGDGKMSSSIGNCIFINDTPKVIENKIKKYAFSGGRDTRAEQEILGANIEVDVSIKYLEIFLFDDDLLNQIKEDYKVGRIMTSDVKKILSDIISRLCLSLQASRLTLSETVGMIDVFMQPRPL